MIISVLNEVSNYILNIDPLEFAGLIFGLLAVIFLIKENILTWPAGIIYVLISFVIFWEAKLYGDFLLHIVFLILNIYGWHSWRQTSSKQSTQVPILRLSQAQFIKIFIATLIGIFAFAQALIYIPSWIADMPPASLPYWDSTTSVLSVTGMWLTAKKYIDNWYYWLVVDILATGIYFYKDIPFYSLLYFIYIGLAIAGYLAWKKSMKLQVNPQ
jgi:nicotinamide mononucleotide transporter